MSFREAGHSVKQVSYSQRRPNKEESGKNRTRRIRQPGTNSSNEPCGRAEGLSERFRRMTSQRALLAMRVRTKGENAPPGA
jgi:hypothetical protein